MPLQPLPTSDYASRPELLDAAKAWAASEGYAVTIARSDKGRAYLKCDRGGVHQNRRGITEENRCRQTGTRLVNCPFSALAKEENGRWYLYTRNAQHNHKPSATQAAHPSLRRLNNEQKTQITELTKAGAAPRTIVAAMRQSQPEETPLLVKDVYNVRLQIRGETLAGKTPIQALVDQLQDDKFKWRVKTDRDGHVTHLIFAALESLSLYQAYPEVLLLDCTYKTNRFHLPLLVVIGITGLHTSFYVAFIFLQGEQETDFVWGLQKLAELLPAKPKIMVTDRDLALMNAISTVFPDT